MKEDTRGITYCQGHGCAATATCFRYAPEASSDASFFPRTPDPSGISCRFYTSRFDNTSNEVGCHVTCAEARFLNAALYAVSDEFFTSEVARIHLSIEGELELRGNATRGSSDTDEGPLIDIVLIGSQIGLLLAALEAAPMCAERRELEMHLTNMWFIGRML